MSQLPTLKLSATTAQKMKDFLVKICEPVDEEGEPAGWRQYLSNMDKGIHCTYYIGKIKDPSVVYEYDEDGNLVEGQEIIYLDGYYADILHDPNVSDIKLPKAIKQHDPDNPVHQFG